MTWQSAVVRCVVAILVEGGPGSMVLGDRGVGEGGVLVILLAQHGSLTAQPGSLLLSKGSWSCPACTLAV